MKIAFYLPRMGDGGVVRATLLLAGEFTANGHAVHLVTVQARGVMYGSLPKGVRLVELGSSRTLSSIPRVAAYLRRERPDAFVAAHYHANIAAIVAKALARGHARIVITERVAVGASLLTERGVKGRALRLLVRKTYPRADAVVTNSLDNSAELAALFRWPPHRVHTIYNPTFAGDVPQRAAMPVDHPWFQPGGPPVILSVGRLSPQKDYPTLLRAFARVRRSLPARLVILGEGPVRPELERLSIELGVQADTALLGHAPNPYAYMAKAALFVLPSRFEGLPNVLIEAQACGVPIVSTACPTGPREILLDGEAGALVPVGDPDAMAAEIVSLLRDDARRARYVAAAAGNLDRFTPRRCYEGYLRLLEGLGVAARPAPVA